ncbi:MAG: aspartate carbamoyltransferase [Nitrososphaerota archaeon]|nr:aspartate carbamoyltransferase [Nitrososphaerota archaeon]MDG6941800.1 aspartate carbamoyltransferase [Nitrososphaerota archaeon]MDG6947027.1 aspartate carbamoyltransferase [Nitrososphaerota archaeon]MDG6950561.1 aspartate carbamoyltransferase [Nitrososphaerota archaeon]
MDFLGRDVVSARDFKRDQYDTILRAVEDLEKSRESLDGTLNGKLAALLFFEPSTRTYSSFQIAAEKLGMRVSGFAGPTGSSITKGETLHDTVRMFEGYGADVFIIRHSKMGAARFAAEVSDVPVVSAGDGSREHPTQAMVDLYAIKKAFGRIDGLKVGMLGDLRYGRTSSSLAYALSNFDVEITFIAPEALQMRPEVAHFLTQRGVTPRTAAGLKEVAGSLDVLYVTRIQKERIPDPTEYEKVKGMYEVNLEALRDAKPSLKVLHPLPRVDELSTDIDETNYAQYFVQAAGGLPLRMVLLNLILGGAR